MAFVVFILHFRHMLHMRSQSMHFPDALRNHWTDPAPLIWGYPVRYSQVIHKDPAPHFLRFVENHGTNKTTFRKSNSVTAQPPNGL